MLYRDWILTPGPEGAGTPPWLVGPNGKAWLQPIGASLDDNPQRAREAVKASFPLICPPDALPVLGNEFSMPRGTIEPEVNYRDRLAHAWVLWPWAGTAYGLLMACHWAGYTNVLLRTQTAKQYSLHFPLTGDPLLDVTISNITPPVHMGGTPAELWNDFVVAVLTPFPTWWGGTAPADGTEEQKAFDRLILRWKSAYSRCVGVSVIDGVAWGVGGLTWGAFSFGAGTVTVWTPPIG